MLTEDLYIFFGHNISVRSNSVEILAHLRSVYGWFYHDHDKDFADKKRQGHTSITFIEIIDDTAMNNEIVIKDKSNTFRLVCSNIHSYENNEFHFDPLGSIQWFLLWTASNLATNYFFIHAGAVASENGGIIFPAVSGFGKTTLTVRLVQKGLKFLSDEVACMNIEHQRMEPFPRKLNLTDESRIMLGLPQRTDENAQLKNPGRKWMFDIKEIAAGSLSGPCKPAYILFLKGFGEKPRMEHIAPSHALFHIFRYSIRRVNDPGLQLFTCAPLFNKMRCFNLVMGDLDETAELIMQLADHGISYDG
jgi:hypothetical protein